MSNENKKKKKKEEKRNPLEDVPPYLRLTDSNKKGFSKFGAFQRFCQLHCPEGGT